MSQRQGAGAIIVGKTNLSLRLFDWKSCNNNS